MAAIWKPDPKSVQKMTIRKPNSADFWSLLYKLFKGFSPIQLLFTFLLHIVYKPSGWGNAHRDYKSIYNIRYLWNLDILKHGMYFIKYHHNTTNFLIVLLFYVSLKSPHRRNKQLKIEQLVWQIIFFVIPIWHTFCCSHLSSYTTLDHAQSICKQEHKNFSNFWCNILL
jgi:hypothetical protein